MSRPMCEKHGSPMFEMSDAFGGPISHYCRACDYQKSAKRYYSLAARAMSRGDEENCTHYTEKAAMAEADEQKSSGRWFDCKVDGEGWDLSENQIDLAKKSGHVVEVITQIV